MMNPNDQGAGLDPTTSSLFANLGIGGGGGGQQLDPETLRTLAALRAMLQGQGQGGQTFINPITQADALSQIRARDNPIMGPASSGVRFLFPGGRVAPGGPNAGADPGYRDSARSAMIANLLGQLPKILGALGQGRGTPGGG